MLRFSEHTPLWFRAFGVLLVVAAISASWLGLADLRLGYWNDETIFYGLLVLSTGVAGYLGVGLGCGWCRLSPIDRDPLLLLWLAWIFWQLLVTLCSDNPWSSWFGPPEQAEGLAWYLCVTLWMLLLHALWEGERARILLLSYSFATMFLLALVHLVSDPQNNLLSGFFFPPIPEEYFQRWIPFIWPDYLGFMVGWWWIACMLSYRALRMSMLLPLLLCTALILLASSNKGAILVFSGVLLLLLVMRVLWCLGAPCFRVASPLARRLASGVLVLPVLWLLAAPWILVRYDREVAQSFPSRVLFNHISLSALAHEPERLLVGHGWGQYSNDFFRYGLVRDLRSYENGEHRANWPLLRGYNYHSHNMAAETLLSLGLVGFLIWLLLPLVALKRLSEGDFWPVAPMLVAVTWLQHLWFAMPQTLPFQAMCWMLLYRVGRRDGLLHAPAARHVSWWGVMVSLLALVLLAWSAQGQWAAMRYTARLEDPFGQYGHPPVTSEILKEDIPRGGDRLRAFFMHFTKHIPLNRDRLTEKHRDLYGYYLDAMEALAQAPHTGAYNAAAVLYGYNMLMHTLDVPLFEPLKARAVASYFPFALEHTKHAPYREDSIAPFLKYRWQQMSAGHTTEFADEIQALLTAAPSHRGALWLGGKLLYLDPHMRNAGVEMMKAAVKLGADRVYPIRSQELYWLQSQ